MAGRLGGPGGLGPLGLAAPPAGGGARTGEVRVPEEGDGQDVGRLRLEDKLRLQEGRRGVRA